MSTTETETTKADTLTFLCDVCKKPVADGEGYIWADAYLGTDKYRRQRTTARTNEEHTHQHLMSDTTSHNVTLMTPVLSLCPGATHHREESTNDG